MSIKKITQIQFVLKWSFCFQQQKLTWTRSVVFIFEIIIYTKVSTGHRLILRSHLTCLVTLADCSYLSYINKLKQTTTCNEAFSSSFCSFGTDKFDNNWYHTNNFIYFILVKKTWMSKTKTFELKHIQTH